MEFDLQWLLLGLPVAFGLGWLASRLDLRQWRREVESSPRAYFKGLNLLLNDQQDKAIDAFIEAVQHDPGSSDLHFALGNLFRRRGEYERAVRVHQHLLERADLAATERDRAQHALAQDFLKAGLFDRAEAAFRALEGTAFATDARLALLGLYERSRDWPAAIEVAAQLEKSGTGSFAVRSAHFHCELAQTADDRGDAATAEAELQRAREVAPLAARPLVQQAQRLMRLERPAEAMLVYAELRQRDPEAFGRLAEDYVACARAAGQTGVARAALEELFARQPRMDLLRALALLEGRSPGQCERLLPLLREQPSLSAALALLDTPSASWAEGAQSAARDAVARAARPLQRYRCAACGFEAQRHFWQCPGCLSWDSFPQQRVEEL
ncbi:MAG: lipopolysaccharide assembly protein LapB [Burkholderiaceae bacterium]|nr:lipopolysaccharide assembly protein LapB [Burkholderiaceae bacterium]